MVPPAAKAPKANKLLEQLTPIMQSPVVDEVTLRRIGVEARHLLHSDARRAHTVLGIVEAVRGNATATREHYGIALKLGAEAVIWVNYVTALTILDEHQAALDVARDGLGTQPDDLGLLEAAIEAAIRSGNFGYAEELCERSETLAPARPYRMRPVVRGLAGAVATGSMTEGGAQALIDALTAIQREQKVRTVGTDVSVCDDTFLYERRVRCIPAVASSMNWQLAGVVAERTDLSSDPGRVLIGGFVGVADGGYRAGNA